MWSGEPLSYHSAAGFVILGSLDIPVDIGAPAEKEVIQ
jgi:hypothetical protein